MTNEQSKRLLDDKSRYGFFNPKSETALTLFILGNIDGWKQNRWNQLEKLKTRSPRSENSRWNKNFFEAIYNKKNIFDDIPYGEAQWNNIEKNFGNEYKDTDLKKSILLFEFEILNKTFNSPEERLFKELSFFNIIKKRKWSRFDAVLIIPEKEKEQFIFFESKLTSDVSQVIKSNQFIRNLESIFLLTNHKESQYYGWKFKYVFICPRKLDQDKLRYYSYVLDSKESIEKYLSNFREIIEKEYKNRGEINEKNYLEYFEKFEREVPGSIIKIYWDELGKLLQAKDQNFFTNYFINLRKGDVGEKQVDSIKERFKKGGITI